MLKFVALDLETTGLNANTDKIIEIGLVKFTYDREIVRLSSLVDCGQKLSKDIIRITGISDADLVGSPKWSEIKVEVENFLEEDDILVGHNIDFDLGFLKKAGIDVERWQKIDTWELASMFIFNINSYSLEYLAKYIKLEYEAHRALNDALAVQFLLKNIYQTVGGFSKKTKSMIKMVLENSNIGFSNVLSEMIEHECPSVNKRSVCPKSRGSLNIGDNVDNCQKGIFLSEKNWKEYIGSIQKKGDVCLLSERVFDVVLKGGKYNNMFDERSTYLCRGGLNNFSKIKEWNNGEAKVLIKLLSRIDCGYWDGNLNQIFWNDDEWEELDKYRCDGIWCKKDCFFDRRLNAITKNNDSIFVSKNFYLENNLPNYSSLNSWGEKILVEDMVTDLFSGEIKFKHWQNRIDSWNSKIETEGEKTFLKELNIRLKILEGLVGIFVKSKGVVNEYGSLLDISLIVKMERSYQEIIEKIAKIFDLVMEINSRYPKFNLELLRVILQGLLEEGIIVQMYIDKKNNSGIRFYRQIFPEKFWSKHAKVELSARTVGVEGDSYPGTIFDGKYQKKLKDNQKKNVLDWTNNKDKFEILGINGYNLAVFSSKNKLEQFIDSIPAEGSKYYQVRDLKKKGRDVFVSGWLLATYYDLNEWLFFEKKFDCVYLDSLFFDVPGELVSSWRQMLYADNSFDKYSVMRMITRFKFILGLLGDDGRLLMGDERFYAKSYGRKIRELLDL